MPITRPAVSYWHELGVRDGGGLVDRFGPDESGSTMAFFVPWEERYDAVKSLLGYSELDGPTAAPTGLMRLTPSQHPDTPTLHATRVTSLSGHRFTEKRTQAVTGGTADLSQYDKARIEVEYNHLSYGILEDGEVAAEYERYTSIESITPSADYLMLPGGTMVYLREPPDTTAPDQYGIPFNVGVILPVQEWKVKWWSLPFDLFSPLEMGPWAKRVFGDGTTRPYVGTVNKTTLFGQPPGTMLFSNVEIIPRRLPLVGLGWDVVFTLARDPNRWNFKYFYSTASGTDANGFYYVARRGGTYEAPGSVTDGQSIYDERELADLWDVT